MSRKIMRFENTNKDPWVKKGASGKDPGVAGQQSTRGDARPAARWRKEAVYRRELKGVEQDKSEARAGRQAQLNCRSESRAPRAEARKEAASRTDRKDRALLSQSSDQILAPPPYSSQQGAILRSLIRRNV